MPPGGTNADGAAENMTEYSYYYRNRERLGFHLFLILMGLFSLLLIVNDLAYIKDRSLLILFFVLRAVNILSLAMIYLAFSRNWGYRVYQTFVLALLVPLLVLMILADLTRPKDYLFGFVFNYLLISFYYFLLPASLPTKIVPPLAITMWWCFSVFALHDYPLGARIVILGTFVGINLFGIVNSLAMKRLQDHELGYRRVLEDALRFKEALTNTPYDSIVLCHEGRIVDANQQFHRLLEIGPVLEPGLSLDDVLPLSGDERQALLQGMPVQGSLVNRQGFTTPIEVRERQVTLAGRDYRGLMIRDRSAEIIESLSSQKESAADRLASLPLSSREKEIVALIVEGRSRFAIADALFISDETVKTHTGNIYRKLGITSKVDLIHMVIGG